MVWSFWVATFIVLYTAALSSIAADAALINEMMANFPDELLIAFGMEGLDMSTVLGGYSFVFLFCQVLLAIQAANYGFSLVSVEERELTADFLLAKPVARRTILTSKLLSALTGLTITNGVAWISSLVAVELFKNGRSYEMTPMILMLSSIVVFQLFFLSVGMVVSLLVKRVRSVTPYAMGLAFGMYLLNAFGGMLGDVKLELVTPFKHFDPNYIVNNEAYDLPLVMITVIVIIASIVGSYRLYDRRDMRSAA
jgi:ABC-2 type transport system permease protein